MYLAPRIREQSAGRIDFGAQQLEVPTIAFWLMMQIGMARGFMTNYPANWLLVRRGVKAEM